ncbi:MAG TPA: thioredoxin family protein, partial [bacterium]|nr:thioredoxin family protein [bacterium]
MIEWIKNSGHLDEVKEKQKNFLILFFYGEFSSNAKRALKELEDFDKENESMPLYIVDVGTLKGIHENYDVESVPTVLALQKGKEVRRIEGVESSQFYARILCGASSSMHKGDTKRSIHRIIVYTGAGCPACGM